MNERLPSVTSREAIKALQRAGFAVSRTSGSHCRLIHEGKPTRSVTVPIHSGDLKRGTLRALISQAGLTVSEFINLLERQSPRSTPGVHMGHSLIGAI